MVHLELTLCFDWTLNIVNNAILLCSCIVLFGFLSWLSESNVFNKNWSLDTTTMKSQHSQNNI